MTTLKELADRKEQLEADLREVEQEIRSRHGEVDESLDPDPAKATAEPAAEPAPEAAPEAAPEPEPSPAKATAAGKKERGA